MVRASRFELTSPDISKIKSHLIHAGNLFRYVVSSKDAHASSVAKFNSSITECQSENSAQARVLHRKQETIYNDVV